MPSHRPTRLAARRVAAAAAAGLVATGCHIGQQVKEKVYDSTRKVLTSSYHDADADAKMATAEGLFNDGKYAAAEPVFSDLADNTYNPVLLAEKARYLEAEAQRLQHHEWDAVATYNRMLQEHAAGAYRERACTRLYEISYEWLKTGTLAEIEAELAGKKPAWYRRGPSLPTFANKSRPPLDEEGEALKYLEAAHTHDLTGPTADKALFWCGYVNFYRARYDEADHFFSQIVELHKDSPLWQEALRLAVISKNNSTGGAVYDSGKAAEALQLVHHAEAVVPEFSKDKEKAAWLNRQKVAVRMQLAEKDFRTAEYYERTRHPASAYFYYNLVERRYPGTRYAELARTRMAALNEVRKQREDGPPAAGGPLDGLRQGWDRLTTRPAKAPPAATEAGPKDGGESAEPPPAPAVPAAGETTKRPAAAPDGFGSYTGR